MPALRKLLLVVVMLAGLCLLAYPHVASWLFERAAVQVTESYDETVASTSEQDLEAAWAKAVEYNENLYGNPVHDPFIEGSGMVMADNYYQVLDLDGSGLMGRISIPKISVNLPIYHGTSEATLAKGVGHLEGSSMPTGGIGTHTVFTGHSGLVNAKLFTDLEELQEGDRFFVKILDKTLAYEIDRLLVVEPEDTTELRRVADKDYCTLVTCTPYGVNTHRLLVRGHRVDYTPEDEAEEAAAAGAGGLTHEQIILIASAVGAVLGVIVVALLVRRRLRNKEADEAVDEALEETFEGAFGEAAGPTAGEAFIVAADEAAGELEQQKAEAIAAIAAAARANLAACGWPGFDARDAEPHAVDTDDENVSDASFAHDVNAFVSASVDAHVRGAHSRDAVSHSTSSSTLGDAGIDGDGRRA